MIKFKTRLERATGMKSPSKPQKSEESTIDIETETIDIGPGKQVVDIYAMTKKELDDYALIFGIRLDRRTSKEKMIEEFMNRINTIN
jgi:hypothetical protein